jgi:hypothetical protein
MATAYVDIAFTITRLSRLLKDVPDAELGNEELRTVIFEAGGIAPQDILDFSLIATDAERLRRDILRRSPPKKLEK